MRTNLMTVAGLFAGVSLASGAFAASHSVAISDGAGQGVQVEIGGPGTSPFFANAQGNDDSFSEFYAMRFDIGGAISAFDMMYGANNWVVDDVALVLTHAETFFSTTGGTGAFYSADDVTDLNSLVYADGIDGSNTLGGVNAAAWTFMAGNDGASFSYNINDVNGLFGSIEGGDSLVTMTIEALDGFTAATYQGIGNFDGGEPVLIINASEIPAPGSLALLGVAGITAARRRR
jgi:hypothetical protein